MRGDIDMSDLPKAYRAIIDPLIATAREILERGETLMPFAFVGNLTTEETYPVMLQTGSDKQKDDSAFLIRHIAHRVEADFVFVIMDAWGLPPDKVGQVLEIIERYGSIGASPYRVDVVSFALETRHGLWVAQEPIKPKGVSKKKTHLRYANLPAFHRSQGTFRRSSAGQGRGRGGSGDAALASGGVTRIL
jgi:hypothetical protein